LMVGGFRGGQLIILAARPGVGKSALAGNFAMHAALSMRSSLMSILEQSERELVERLLAGHSRVDHRRIQEGNLDEQETFAVEESGEKLVNSPLYFDDVPRRSVADISAIARRHKRKHGLDLLVIDYLQLLQPDDPRQVREQQVSGMTRGLKFLAKEMNVPVICLAQLNRGVENREDKTPRLSDLRESGAIEQDADVVMFIDRPHEYDKAANPADAFLHVAKNRGGSKGKVDLVWRATNLLFLPKAPFDPGGF
jgi:replicative DNA helicase